MGTRKAAVAGQFYPGNAAELGQVVEQYLSQSDLEAAPDHVAAVVAPHAGYAYSGQAAAFAYARVRGKKPERVILLGGAHRFPVDKASVFESGVFETPVGSFPVDEAFSKAVAKEFGSDPAVAHLDEHCLEVQLPFLHAVVGEVPIVPVLFGWPPSAWHARVGEKLAAMAGENDLVVASTDLSHYLPDERAHRVDKRTLDAILTQDCSVLIEGIERRECSLCGAAAVVAAMAYARARGALAWSILDYRTSANTTGDYDRVVGYAAISMEKEP